MDTKRDELLLALEVMKDIFKRNYELEKMMTEELLPHLPLMIDLPLNSNYATSIALRHWTTGEPIKTFYCKEDYDHLFLALLALKKEAMKLALKIKTFTDGHPNII